MSPALGNAVEAALEQSGGLPTVGDTSAVSQPSNPTPALTLTWRHDAHSWVARCGDEQQGEARVVPFRGGWAWIVDMLPCSAEPSIVSDDTYVRLPDAKADAERQVQEWPTPIEGARRV